MRELADTGRTIVCTIHQPNSEIFNMLCLLSEGNLAYIGPEDEALRFFDG
jgi:ABC-type multidrug transport system ATPase subunit